MDTNEKYKEYQVGILELITEIWETERVLIGYKTTADDFLSSTYALYKRYKRPVYDISQEELQNYILEHYLNDFIVVQNGVVIGESIYKADTKDKEYQDLLNTSIEDVISEFLNKKKNGNTKVNEYEISFEEVNNWEDIKPYDTYKDFFVYNYLYHDVLFEKIRITIDKMEGTEAPLEGYEYDIHINASITNEEARMRFNKPPKPYTFSDASASMYNSRKALDGCDFKYAVESIINELLDQMCKRYGGLKK